MMRKAETLAEARQRDKSRFVLSPTEENRLAIEIIDQKLRGVSTESSLYVLDEARRLLLEAARASNRPIFRPCGLEWVRLFLRRVAEGWQGL